MVPTAMGISSDSDSEHGPTSLWARLDALEELETKFITTVQQHIRQHQEAVAGIRKYIREDQQKRLKNEKSRRVRLEKVMKAFNEASARVPQPPSSARPDAAPPLPVIQDDEHLQHTVAELDRLMAESGGPPLQEPDPMPLSDPEPEQVSEPAPSIASQASRVPVAPMGFSDLAKPADRPVQKAKCSIRRGKKARIPTTTTRTDTSSASTPDPTPVKLRPTRGVDSGIANRNGSRTPSSRARDRSVDSPTQQLSSSVAPPSRPSSSNSIPEDPYLFSITVIRQLLGGGKINGPVWHVSYSVHDPFQYAMIVDPATTADVPDAPMEPAGILDLSGFEWMGDLSVDEKLVFPLFLKRAKGWYQYMGDFIFTEYLHLGHDDFAKIPEDVRNYWINRIAQPNKDKLVQMMLSEKGQSRSLTALDVDRNFRQREKNSGFQLSKVVVTPSEWNRETYRTLVGLAKEREEDRRLSDIDPSTRKREVNRLRDEEATPKRTKRRIEEQNADQGAITFPLTTSRAVTASGGGNSVRSRRSTGVKTYDLQKMSRQLTDDEEEEGNGSAAPRPSKKKKGMVMALSSENEEDEE